MKTIEARLAVFAALLALAGPAMSHGCEDHLPLYLQGSYEDDYDESAELAHGHGEARGADHYVDEWVQGKPSGKGIYTWENGARYEGEFKNGKVDGKGLYTSPKFRPGAISSPSRTNLSFTIAISVPYDPDSRGAQRRTSESVGAPQGAAIFPLLWRRRPGRNACEGWCGAAQALARARPRDDTWRPQPDSNRCYRRERAMS